MLFLIGSFSSAEESYHVEWVKTIDSTFQISKNKSFFAKVKDFIIGADEIIIKKPYSLIANDTNTIWIIDQAYQAPLKLNCEKGTLEVLGIDNNNLFPSMNSIAFLNNFVIFSDSKNNKIYRINNDGEISVLIDTLYLKQPTGISFNKTSNQIAVSSTAEHKIKVFSADGKFIIEIGHRGEDSLGFNFPTFLNLDSDGNNYIIDNMNYRLKIYNKNWDLLSYFGEQGDMNGYFAFPKGFAIDKNKNIYIADALQNCVQIFNDKGELLLAFGNYGDGKYEFNFPTSVFVDKQDLIYVSDFKNGRIQIYKLVKD